MGIAVPAKSVETVPIEQIPSRCIHYVENSGSKVRLSCFLFVNNSIDAAAVTDKRVIKEHHKEHFWIDRAVQTHVGNHFNRYESSFYANFSLNTPISSVELLYRVTASLQNNPLKFSLIPARGLAYLTLSSHYSRKIDLADTNS